MTVNILFFLIILFICKFSKKIQINGLPKNTMTIAFLIKAFTGLVFSYIYIYSVNIEPSDSMRFMEESKLLYDVYFKSKSDFFSLLTSIGENNRMTQQHLNKTFIWNAGNFSKINDSRNTIRLHTLIQFISFGQSYIHVLIMCFISLIGIKQIYTTIKPYSQIKSTYLFYSLLLLPSLLFWSSGIVKEPLMIFGIGCLLRALIHSDKLAKRITFGLIGTLFLILFKPYILICILPSILFFCSNKYIFKNRIVLSLLSFGIFLLLILYTFPEKRQSVTEHISRKQFDMENVGKGGIHVYGNNCFYYFKPQQYKNLKIEKDSVQIIHPTKGILISFDTKIIPSEIYLNKSDKKNKIHIIMPGTNSHIKTKMIDNSFSQLVLNIPEALVNSFFRPFPFDSGSLLKYPSLFEVWFIAFFLILAFIKRRQVDKETQSTIIGLLFFSMILLLLTGWTTPINGALVRFRFPAQLALFIVGSMLIKIKTKKHE